MSDRRETLRTRTFLGGVISFSKRRSTLDCNVRNLSVGGARIELVNTALLPDEFDLTIARKEATYRVRTAWCSEGTAGVAFAANQASSAVPLDWARKLKAVETENRVLRRRIAELSEGAV